METCVLCRGVGKSSVFLNAGIFVKLMLIVSTDVEEPLSHGDIVLF